MTSPLWIDRSELTQHELRILPPWDARTFRVLFEPRNIDALLSAMQAAFRGESVAVIALGGSETIGRNCDRNGKAGKRCSWPARVFQWVKRESGNDKLEFFNLARGGTTSLAILPVLNFILDEAVKGRDFQNILVFLTLASTMV